ncbi:MAG: GNAT family N-acetyltransferase [Pseudomonadota bacterium]
MNIDLLDPAKVDLGELAWLAHVAFKGVTGTSHFSALTAELQNAEHYWRKYHAAAGRARIAAVRENGNLLAMNAMVPVALRSGSGTALGWQSCDTATHPDARGRGLFMACLKALKEQLADGDIFFGYPNANSMPGLTKFGWGKRAVLDAYVALLPGISDEPGIRQIDRFDSHFDPFARSLVSAGSVCIERSAAYLNWRYFSSPQSPYAALVYDMGAGLEGYAVVRAVSSGARRVCIVMEVFGATLDVERTLLRAATGWARRARAWPTVMFTNRWGDRTWLRHGWMRLPRRLSPRQLVLMGSGVGQAGQQVFDLDWRAFVGDWDVF